MITFIKNITICDLKITIVLHPFFATIKNCMSNVEKNSCILGHMHHNVKLLNPY